MGNWRLGHRPGLDGLRGIAILLVLAGHALPDHYAAAGSAGVSVFFVLSGFLITSLLLERAGGGTELGLGSFYARRARRLLPAALTFLVAMIALGSLLGAWLATPSRALAPLFFVQNFAAIGTQPDEPVHAVDHMWSLSVEEQFYFVWPVVLMLCLVAARRHLVKIVGALLVASLTLRIGLLATGAGLGRIYYAPDTNACLLLLGCLVAAAVHQRGGPPAVPSWVGWAALAAVGVLGALRFGSTSAALVPVAAALVGVVLVLVALSADAARSPRWLNWTGQRSYALYLWHYPLVVVIPMNLPNPSPVAVAAGLGLSFAIAAGSWRYIEEPFLRRRTRTTPAPLRRAQMPAAEAWASD